MSRALYPATNNAEGQLNSGISAATLTIALKSGEGAEFPQPYTGDASSTGSSTTLNDTGGLANAAVGDFIHNVTDDSWAVVTVAGTNSVTTTRLRGGTDNTWQSGDEWRINEFVITLEKRDVDGDVTAREMCLIKNRSTDTLTVATGGRGFDSSTAQTFDADDYVNLHAHRAYIREINQILCDLARWVTGLNDDVEDLETSDAYYVVAGGSANAFTASYPNIAGPVAAGMRFVFKANHTITGATTLTLTLGGSAQSAKDIKKVDGSTALASGDIQNGQIVEVVYDGTNLQMTSLLGNAAASVTQTNIGCVTAASSNAGGGTGTETAMSPTWTGSNDVGSGKLNAAGAFCEITLSGKYRMDSGTAVIRLKAGGTTLCQFPISAADTADRQWNVRGVLTARTVGASASLLFTGIATVSNDDGSGADEQTRGVENASSSYQHPAAVTLDTTGALAVTATIDFTAADAGQYANIETGTITLQKAPV